MEFNIASPRYILVGGGTAGRIAEVLGKFGLSRPLVVTDPMMVSLGLVNRILEPLAKAGITAGVFSDTIPEPTDTVVAAGCQVLKSGNYDCLIGFGGGSPIDTAKAMAILATGDAPMSAYKVPQVNDHGALPVIAIPTTARTGSAATRFTVSSDAIPDEKMLIAGLGALPLAAIVDYELTLSVPKRTTADTGIDALSHALEAYVSRRATPYSDALAVAAMELIGPNLRQAYLHPTNTTAREAMMLGALQAGIAFSNASVALVHGMSRPIGAHFHVPHGLSNAMLLPAVTRFSIPAALPRYAEASRRIGFARRNDSDERAADLLADGLAAWNTDLSVPTPRGFGIDPAVWQAKKDLMADQALASGSPANNPRIPDKAEIIALYDAVWGANA